jgi:hypothetical protein
MNGPKSLSVFDAALGSPQAQQICGVPFGRALRMRRQKARRGHGFPRRHGFDVTANPLTARFCFPLDLTRSGRKPLDPQEIGEWREGRCHWRG